MDAAKTLLPYLVGAASYVRPRETAKWATQAMLTPQRYQRPLKETLIWEMGEPITFPSGRHARLYGERGPVIVAVHGWEGRGSQFAEFIEPLTSRGFQVLAWDGPAHGDSPGRRTNIVEFTRALMDDLSTWPFPIHALVGHSFGGSAATLAKAWGLGVKAVVTIGTPSTISGVINRSFEKYRLSSDARDHFIGEIRRRTGFEPRDLDVARFADDLKVPFLVVHDQDDNAVPLQDGKDLATLLPQARTIITTGLGHYRILKSNAVARQVVEFLDSVR